VGRLQKQTEALESPEKGQKGAKAGDLRGETGGSHLTERFGVARLGVHDFWYFPHRVIRKVLSHTVGVLLNLHSGRPPLDLDSLVPL